MTGTVDASTDAGLGRRGQRTRSRLLDATAGLLETERYRDVKVVDIARDAGTSPATFYQYFSDVEDAVRALAEAMVDSEAPMLGALVADADWSGSDGMTSAYSLVDGFLALWDRHRPLLRVIDLATDEGDERFRSLRTRLLAAPSEALVAVFSAFDVTDRPDPHADAGVLVSMLAHVSAHREGLESWGARTADLRRSMARIVHSSIVDGADQSS